METKLCACGCQRPLTPSPKNRHPIKYIKGHGAQKFGSPRLPSGLKWCSKCRKPQPVSAFGKNKRTKDGLQPRCKKHINAYCANWHKKHSNRSKATRLRAQLKSFGISTAQYQTMLAGQKGVCAICLQPETSTWKGSLRRLAIDHCHQTGKVRGLLCHKCNPGLGAFKHNPEFLRKAARYLET